MDEWYALYVFLYSHGMRYTIIQIQSTWRLECSTVLYDLNKRQM